MMSVGSMAARLTVLEAQQVALQAENGRLKGDNNLLQMEVESLQTQLEDYINGQCCYYFLVFRFSGYVDVYLFLVKVVVPFRVWGGGEVRD